MQIPRIDPKNAAGLVDKVVGLGKEIVGTVAGNDRLANAGQVQQDKGTERLKATKAQTRADGHEAKANAAEQRQKAAQSVKEATS
ncbi:hypothetical protein SAMN05443575_4107 [Jatrophihabitans endophyticus]|uniref:CsbD-like n=1 Tax=Jatrophihabitans endophyticus TaxID=1206085 RepID=A0A1M5U1F8_9ACTN|nr:hypothetical protein [Jatrophihabitans endophyticus]SHH56862.1 hypothetical protein SAMN05443575_4107 [Jatrophihabitans endophyticus]